jgi:hypothetical protein
MTTQVIFFLVAGAAMLLAVVAAVREKQRINRPNLDQVGWVPWNLLQILSGIVAVVAIVLAFKLH